MLVLALNMKGGSVVIVPAETFATCMYYCCPAGFVLFTLGLVIFIPGFYYSRISYYAYKGHPGFSFDTIPAV